LSQNQPKCDGKWSSELLWQEGVREVVSILIEIYKRQGARLRGIVWLRKGSETWMNIETAVSPSPRRSYDDQSQNS
jgi:hypothetical protein